MYIPTINIQLMASHSNLHDLVSADVLGRCLLTLGWQNSRLAKPCSRAMAGRCGKWRASFFVVIMHRDSEGVCGRDAMFPVVPIDFTLQQSNVTSVAHALVSVCRIDRFALSSWLQWFLLTSSRHTLQRAHSETGHNHN